RREVRQRRCEIEEEDGRTAARVGPAHSRFAGSPPGPPAFGQHDDVTHASPALPSRPVVPLASLKRTRWDKLADIRLAQPKTPRPSEDIDIGAIVRLAPGLVSPPKSLSGSVALEATGKRGAARTYVLTAKRGRVTVAEHDDEDADARVSGSQKAWIAAFGPEASRTALKIEGNKKLAAALLDELAQVASAGRATAV